MKQNLASTKVKHVYIYRVGREDDEEEEEKRQSFYIRLKEKPLAKNDSPQSVNLHRRKYFMIFMDRKSTKRGLIEMNSHI